MSYSSRSSFSNIPAGTFLYRDRVVPHGTLQSFPTTDAILYVAIIHFVIIACTLFASDETSRLALAQEQDRAESRLLVQALSVRQEVRHCYFVERIW